jgi:VanZ family protein
VGISTPGDVAKNVVLFVPLGIAAALRPSWTRAWSNRAFLILAAAALSYGLETFQTTLPARYPSLIDVAANTTGTLLGMLCGNVRRRR